jgi:hypothetical protein
LKAKNDKWLRSFQQVVNAIVNIAKVEAGERMQGRVGGNRRKGGAVDDREKCKFGKTELERTGCQIQAVLKAGSEERQSLSEEEEKLMTNERRRGWMAVDTAEKC